MISIGRRNKSLVLAFTLVFVFLLFLWTPSKEAAPLVSTMERANLGIGKPSTPTNDEPPTPQHGFIGDSKDEADTLLSGAKIEEDETPLKDTNNIIDSTSDKINTPKSSKLKQDDTVKSEKAPETVENFNSQTDKSVAGSSSSNENHKYVIMIDAGSTGSRVHVYTFDTSVSPPKLLNEEFKMLKPGLSSFDTDTVGAATSLDPLLKVALDSIPKDKHSCSPVAVKATAGLRFLGSAKSDAILKEVRRHLEKDYPFPVVEDNGVSIMDGSDEGVYAWITANYLLGNIGSPKKEATAAVFDLGGGSTQIVFEPLDGEAMIEGEHKYEISFGGREFILYQYSHLGYGLMQGRRRVNAAVLQAELDGGNTFLKPISDAEAKDDTTVADVTVENPCVPPGVKANNVVVEMDDKTNYIVNFISPDTSEKDTPGKSASTQCRFISEAILNKELECESKSCSFNGIYQPSLKNQFSKEADMYVFSYFYDRLQPIGMPSSFTLQEMKEITQLVCSGSTLWNEYFPQKPHLKELEDEPLWCMDLTFMTSLLHIGYDIPLNRELRTAKKIEGNELGWCLGASLPLLDKDSGWTCKVKKNF